MPEASRSPFSVGVRGQSVGHRERERGRGRWSSATVAIIGAVMPVSSRNSKGRSPRWHRDPRYRDGHTR